jgi:hypothetical protein
MTQILSANHLAARHHIIRWRLTMFFTVFLPSALVHLRAFAISLDETLACQIIGFLIFSEETTCCQQITFLSHRELLSFFPGDDFRQPYCPCIQCG